MESKMSGFSVFYPGLITASDSFAQQASTYESLVPDGGWSCPTGGDDAIDRVMNLTLMALGNAHNITADVIDSHAWKLRKAHQTYSKSESDVVAAILNAAYESNGPLDSSKSQAPNTVLDLPGVKHFVPAPLSLPAQPLIATPSWNDLRYWDYENLGLGVAGPPQRDPWIGGDIKGLSQLAVKLRWFSYQGGKVDGQSGSAAPPGSVIDNLNGAVRKLLQQSGEWSGPAVQSFGTSYSNDAANVHVLSEVAGNSAQAISVLAMSLYKLEIVLENIARPLVERGYRVQCDGTSMVATPVSGIPGWNPDSYLKSCNKLYSALQVRARTNRATTAHQLSQEYQKAVGILQFYADETTFWAQSLNINMAQKDILNTYINNLNSLQKSYATVEKGLGLNWQGAGETAVQAAASAGKWGSIAGPIASVILALITA